MKINLTTTTITPEKDTALTFEQLKSAPSGVYLCREHVCLFPTQRIVATKRGLTLFDVIGGNVTIQPVPAEYCDDCRFILAPEQVVNITFAKEERPECCGTIAAPDEYRARREAGTTLSLLASEEEYIAAQAAAGFKPGDKVRVVRAADSHEYGWGNSWTPGMDAYVGRGVYTVRSIQEHGIDLEESATGKSLPDGSAQFPFFVLEKVAAPAEIERGNSVRVLRIPTRGENGWTDYVEALDGAVGGVFEVASVFDTERSFKKAAVLKGCGFSLPLFVLEKVS